MAKVTLTSLKETKGQPINFVDDSAFGDTFDALTTNRPYRKGFTASQALSIMNKARASQFDPDLLDIFLRCFKKGKLELVKD